MNWILLRLGDLTSVLPMTMKHLFASGITILTCSVTTFADVSVKPAEMKIIWDSLSNEFYGANQGMHFSFHLNSDGKSLIGHSAADSDITVKAGGQDLGGKFNFWETFSKDRKTMRLEAATEKLPERRASKFRLSGNIEVLLASKKVTKSTEIKAFKKGDKVTLSDDFAFEIIGFSKPKPEWEDEALNINLEWKQDISLLAEVRFYDAEGKIIESREAGSTTSESSATKMYALKKKPEVFKIEMDFWEDIETVTVPLKVNLSLSGAE